VGTTVFDGDFYIDLTGAASTWGSSWTLVDTNTLAETFSSTFTVSGWTDNGDGRWITIANGTEYTFTEGTGILYVPEPTSLAMLLGGAGMLAVLRRNRRS
jgi:hypothetical protein